jgi:hypothetical protein
MQMAFDITYPTLTLPWHVRMTTLLPQGFGSAHWRYAEREMATAMCSVLGYAPGVPANDPEF